MDRRGVIILFAAVGIVASAVALAYLVYQSRGPPPGSNPDSFLIVAGSNGYNGSVDHPGPWPVVTVQRGSMVTLTVYNSDVQAHGFQVAHYFDSGIETVPPGKSVTISFVADAAGTFRIYCSIPCTVHAFMLDGQLIVQ